MRRSTDDIVGGVFSSVASNYDLMNDSMSLGVHRIWKDNFVSTMLPRLPPSFHHHPESLASTTRASNPKFKCLDVAGGTGDIALRILDRAREKFASRDVEVEIVDLNMGMLDEGRKRVAKTLYYNSESILLGCSVAGKADNTSSTDRFHSWQCSIPTFTYSRQFHRPLHYSFRYQELYIYTGSPK